MVTNWVCNEIIIVSSSLLTPKEGWVYQYFFVLKYRRQFKQRQQIMGHCCSKEIFLDKFIGALILCQNERNLSILALILILAAFLFLLHIFGGLNNPNKGISTLTGALVHSRLFCFLATILCLRAGEEQENNQVSGVETLRWISSGFLMFSVEPKIL